VLAGITFMIFFQGYMFAPMIPGWPRPSASPPKGSDCSSRPISSLRGFDAVLRSVFGLDRASAHHAGIANQMIACRLLTGFGASGVVRLALAMVP
jgi:hypothetical protein